MEIPTVKLELYRQDQSEFTRQIKLALENIGVLQVDGLEQRLVDDLYDRMKKCSKLIFEAGYLGKSFYRYTAGLPSYRFPYKLPGESEKELVRLISMDVNKIVDTIYDSSEGSYLKIAYPDPILIGYHKGPKMESLLNRKNMMIKKHADDQRLILAAPASAPGLEGLLKNRWIPLQPEPSHLLIWGGIDLKSFSSGRVKPLVHRVRFPAEERWALLFAYE